MDATISATFHCSAPTPDQRRSACSGTLRVEFKEGDYRWSQEFSYRLDLNGPILDYNFQEIELWYGQSLVRKVSLALPMKECDRMLMYFFGMALGKSHKDWLAGIHHKASGTDLMSFDMEPLLSVAQDMCQNPPIFDDAAFGEDAPT